MRKHSHVIRGFGVDYRLAEMVAPDAQRLASAHVDGRGWEWQARQVEYVERRLRFLGEDVFLSLWKYWPRLRDEEELDEYGQVNRKFIQYLQQRDSYKKLRRQTRGKVLESVIASQQMIQYLLQLVTPGQMERQRENALGDSAINTMFYKAEKGVKDLRKAKPDLQSLFGDDLDALNKALQNMAGQQMADMPDLQGVQQGLAPGAPTDQNDPDAPQIDAPGGLHAGDLPGQLEMQALDTLAALATLLNQRMDWMDILKIFRSMLRQMGGALGDSVGERGADLVGVTYGANLALTLPMALAKLGHPVRRKEFYHDLIERRLPQYQTRFVQPTKPGGVIVLLDVSGSMGGAGNDKSMWASALALAAFSAMRRRNKPFAVIPFESYPAGRAIWRPLAGDPVKPVIELCTLTGRGGTHFDLAADAVLALKDDVKVFRPVDVLWLTDGESTLDEAVRPWLRSAKEYGFRTNAIMIDTEAKPEQLQKLGLSDVWHVPAGQISLRSLEEVGVQVLQKIL